MTRKTLFAGLVFAGLILLAVALLRSPEKGADPVEERPAPAAKIGAGEVDTLEITRKGGSLVVKKEGGGEFFIVKPQRLRAEANGALLAFGAIEKLEWGHVVSDRRDRHDEFELGTDSVRVVAKKGDRVLLDIRVGKTTKLRTMVRLEGHDEVWSVANLMKYMVDRDLADWRHASIVTFEKKDAVKLTVLAQDGTKIVLSRPAGDPPAAWQLVESLPRMERFDSDMVEAALTQLASWKANGHADEVSEKEAGLDRPALTVAVGLAGGQEHAASLGKKKGEEDLYVRVTGDPQIYLLKKWNLDRIGRRPSDYRDKVPCALTPAEIGAIVVTRGPDSYTLERRGEGFVVTQPPGITIAPWKASDIVGVFSDWKGLGFAEVTKTSGLTPPAAVISVKAREGDRRCTIKVGGPATEKFNVLVQTEGQRDALVSSRLSVDRVLVKLDDLKKK